VSNLSYMKRVMMLVLPTDWSPKKTSLYLARGDTVTIFFLFFVRSLRTWITRIWVRSESESLKIRDPKKQLERIRKDGDNSKCKDYIYGRHEAPNTMSSTVSLNLLLYPFEICFTHAFNYISSYNFLKNIVIYVERCNLMHL